MLSPDYLVHSVFDVDINFLNKNNAKAVIFDIDNTLVGFTVERPTEQIAEYINGLRSLGIKAAVASNNNKHRVGKFCESLDIPYISRACKPLPFALFKLCRQMAVKPKNTVFVGDQVYTDSLGANLAGMTSVMVDIIDTKETLTFKIKRALEKPVIKAKKRKDAKNK